MAQHLRRIYLSVHALTWLDIPPGAPRRRELSWEQFPGRCELSHALEEKLKQRCYDLIESSAADEAIFFLPTKERAHREWVAHAEMHMGDRAIVSRFSGGWNDDVRESLGADFVAEVEEERGAAEQQRAMPPGSISDAEFDAWAGSRACAADLTAQLAERGYSFDPASTEFVAMGEDWTYCAGTYPIHIGRALGLRYPVARRFDLMNPDESSMLLRSTAVEQNLELSDHVRLFIFEVDERNWAGMNGFNGGGFAAQYWDGLHGLADAPHTVSVEFPPDSAVEVDLWGSAAGRSWGHAPSAGGAMKLSVGAGGHTPYPSTLVRAHNDMSLEEFRSHLLKAEVGETHG